MHTPMRCSPGTVFGHLPSARIRRFLLYALLLLPIPSAAAAAGINADAIGRYFKAIQAKDFESLYGMSPECKEQRQRLQSSEPAFLRSQRLDEHSNENRKLFESDPVRLSGGGCIGSLSSAYEVLLYNPSWDIVEISKEDPSTAYVRFRFPAATSAPLEVVEKKMFQLANYRLVKEQVVRLSLFSSFASVPGTVLYHDGVPFHAVTASVQNNHEMLITTFGPEKPKPYGAAFRIGQLYIRPWQITYTDNGVQVGLVFFRDRLPPKGTIEGIIAGDKGTVTTIRMNDVDFRRDTRWIAHTYYPVSHVTTPTLLEMQDVTDPASPTELMTRAKEVSGYAVREIYEYTGKTDLPLQVDGQSWVMVKGLDSKKWRISPPVKVWYRATEHEKDIMDGPGMTADFGPWGFAPRFSPFFIRTVDPGASTTIVIEAGNARTIRESSKVRRETPDQPTPKAAQAAPEQARQAQAKLEQLLNPLPALFGGESSGRRNRWPMRVRIVAHDRSSHKVEGEIEWPTLNAVHRMEGTLVDGTLVIREVGYIRKGQAGLGCAYELQLEGDHVLVGTWGACTGSADTGHTRLER